MNHNPVNRAGVSPMNDERIQGTILSEGNCTTKAHAQDLAREPRVQLRIAATFFERVRGLLGTSPSPNALMIVPCKSIHTFGMSYPIHIAFFDSDGTIIAADTSVEPRSRRACRHACGVIEMASECAGSSWFSTGENVAISLVRQSEQTRSKPTTYSLETLIPDKLNTNSKRKGEER